MLGTNISKERMHAGRKLNAHFSIQLPAEGTKRLTSIPGLEVDHAWLYAVPHCLRLCETSLQALV